MKNLEILGEIWKFPKNLKSENLNKKWKIWKSEKSWKFWTNLKISIILKKISKSQNLKKSRNFWKEISKSKTKILFSKIEVSTFFIFHRTFFLINIPRTKYFEHSFMSKSHFCDFACFHPHFTHQMTLKWPSNYPQMSLNEICDILKKMFGYFVKTFWKFVNILFYQNFLIFFEISIFRSRVSDLGFALRFSYFLQNFRFWNVFSGYLLKLSIYFFCIWTGRSAIFFYDFFCLWFSVFFAEIFDFYCWFCDGRTDEHLKKQSWNPINMKLYDVWSISFF